MISFLNYSKKWLCHLFQKNISETLMSFYQHSGLNSVQWVSMAINKKIIANSILTKEIELLTKTDALSLKIADKKDALNHQVWINQEKMAAGDLPNESQYINEYNLLIDRIIEEKVTFFQHCLREISSKTFSPNEVSQDEKALEWIKVSFGLLEKAVIEGLTNPDFLFQCLLFMGINPKTSMPEIRLICYNLDIKYEFLKNHTLRICIYNDKDGEFGSQKKASLIGDFDFRKREMFDELTKLISSISSGIKIS